MMIAKLLAGRSPGKGLSIKLSALLIAGAALFIRLTGLIQLTKFIAGFTIITIIGLVSKMAVSLKKRAEAMKIYEKGNIPSVPERSLFSGNFFEIYRPPNNLHIMDLYHRKLGETYATFYGPDPWILTVDLDLIQRVFASTIEKNQFNVPALMHRSLVQLQGDEWRRTRRALNPTLGSKKMKSDHVSKDIEDICSAFMAGIDNLATINGLDATKTGVVVDVLHNFQKYSMEVLFKVAYGRTKSLDFDPSHRDNVVNAVHEGAILIASPVLWLGIMFHPIMRFFHFLYQQTSEYYIRNTKKGRYLGQIFVILEECVRERRQKFGQKESYSSSGQPQAPTEDQISGDHKMIDTLIELLKSKQIDEETFTTNKFFLFVAGFETTANTLTVMFWLLAKHPQVQEKLRKALCSDGEKAQYLDWCIKETLRLYPVVPTAAGRIVPETFTHKGMTIHKGTSVIANIYSIHHWPKHWGPDVEQFRPERFGEIKLHPAQYFAFAIGPRRCIGGNLAMAEMQAIVTKLLMKYRIEACETTPEMIDFTSTNLIHITINGSVDLKFKRIDNIKL